MKKPRIFDQYMFQHFCVFSLIYNLARMFNSTILVGLILSKYVGYQPLMTFPIQNLPFSLSISSFRFTNFSNSALFTRTGPRIKIEQSLFSFFTRSPIIIARPSIFDPMPNESRQICLSEKCFMTNFELSETTFQTCSTIRSDRPSDDGSDSKNVSGGAIYIDFACTINRHLKITQCNFLYCHAGRYGGALYIHNPSNPSDPNFDVVSFTYFQHCDVGFISNQTGISPTGGGAIYCISKGFQITACNFSNCGIDYPPDRENLGGVIYADLTNTLRVRFSEFARCAYIFNRTATFGGAIYAKLSTDGKVEIEYTNFSSCFANSSGSALYLEGNLVNVSIYFSIFNDCRNADSVIWIKNIIGSVTVYLHEINLRNISLSCPYFCAIENGTFSSSLGNNDLYCPASYSKSKFSPIFDQNCIYEKTFPINAYIIPLDDSDLYTTYPIPPSTGEGSVTTSIAPSSPLSDSIPTSTNPDGDSVIDNQSNGLSTVAIVFIILAVIIVLAMIIFAIIFCVKKGICSDNTYRVQDIRYLGQGDAIRETTYF